MTDRVPGAPGQYRAMIAPEELLKMQSGADFAITITRDDQPITEGTPYSKAAVLPDALAAQLCPDVDDPTPADAFAAVLPLLGGSMKGGIAMNGNAITGLPDIDTMHKQDAVGMAASAGYAKTVGFHAHGTTADGIDLDSIGQGYYTVSSTNPVRIGSEQITSGHVLTFQVYGQSTRVQLLFNKDGGAYFRVAWYGQEYSNWVKFTTTVVSGG